jgi:hypothetical protein
MRRKRLFFVDDEAPRAKIDTLAKWREPNDTTRNDARLDAAQLGDAVSTVSETAQAQRALATTLLTPRKRQNQDTLRPRSSATMLRKPLLGAVMRPTQAQPLEALVRCGFLSRNYKHTEELVEACAKEIHTDEDYMAHLRGEAKKIQDAKREKGHDTTSPKKQDYSIIKLNLIGGNIFYMFGYHRKAMRRQSNQVLKQYDTARADRLAAFFADDPLDELESELSEVRMPGECLMFRRLQEQYGTRYKLRDAALREAGGRVPKVDAEIVSRQYITQYRKRPIEGDALCRNGERCLFATFSDNRSDSYVGRVFRTERENKKQPAEGETYGNVGALCIDCLLYAWTLTHLRNVADDEAPVHRQFNYFTVLCEQGQYGRHMMLSNVENGRPTGIVGHVPRYAGNNRAYQEATEFVRVDGALRPVTARYLAETGVDFC